MRMHGSDVGGRDAATSVVGAFGARVARRLVDWIDDRRYLRECDRLIDEAKREGSLDSLLEALDVTPQQFGASRVSPIVAAELSQRMLRHLGCETHIADEDRRSVSERCRACKAWKTCRRWLDRSVADARYREFCANTEVFDRVQRVSRSPGPCA